MAIRGRSHPTIRRRTSPGTGASTSRSRRARPSHDVPVLQAALVRRLCIRDRTPRRLGHLHAGRPRRGLRAGIATMTALTWQTLLLLAAAYLAGCCLACLTRRLFGRAPERTRAVAAAP